MSNETEQQPVAYVLFSDGEVCYAADDSIVISDTPGDESDLFKWLPVYTATQLADHQYVVAEAEKKIKDGLVEALEHITALSRVLRQCGPLLKDLQDLQDLSDALEAICRAVVAHKLGHEVEIPAELAGGEQ